MLAAADQTTGIAQARAILDEATLERRRKQLLVENEASTATYLKKWLKDRGMPHSGKKSVLAARKTEREFEEETHEIMSQLTRMEEHEPLAGSLEEAVYKEALHLLPMTAAFHGNDFSVEEAGIMEVVMGIVRVAQQVGALEMCADETEFEREVQSGIKHAARQLERKQDIEYVLQERYQIDATFDGPRLGVMRFRGGAAQLPSCRHIIPFGQYSISQRIGASRVPPPIMTKEDDWWKRSPDFRKDPMDFISRHPELFSEKLQKEAASYSSITRDRHLGMFTLVGDLPETLDEINSYGLNVTFKSAKATHLSQKIKEADRKTLLALAEDPKCADRKHIFDALAVMHGLPESLIHETMVAMWEHDEMGSRFEQDLQHVRAKAAEASEALKKFDDDYDLVFLSAYFLAKAQRAAAMVQRALDGRGGVSE